MSTAAPPEPQVASTVSEPRTLAGLGVVLFVLYGGGYLGHRSEFFEPYYVILDPALAFGAGIIAAGLTRTSQAHLWVLGLAGFLYRPAIVLMLRIDREGMSLADYAFTPKWRPAAVAVALLAGSLLTCLALRIPIRPALTAPPVFDWFLWLEAQTKRFDRIDRVVKITGRLGAVVIVLIGIIVLSGKACAR